MPLPQLFDAKLDTVGNIIINRYIFKLKKQWNSTFEAIQQGMTCSCSPAKK